MGNTKNSGSTRRQFFSLLTSNKKEKVKMLTPDGKLVEVDKSVIDQAAKTKAGNKEIYEWMQNPSKQKD